MTHLNHRWLLTYDCSHMIAHIWLLTYDHKCVTDVNVVDIWLLTCDCMYMIICVHTYDCSHVSNTCSYNRYMIVHIWLLTYDCTHIGATHIWQHTCDQQICLLTCYVNTRVQVHWMGHRLCPRHNNCAVVLFRPDHASRWWKTDLLGHGNPISIQWRFSQRLCRGGFGSGTIRSCRNHRFHQDAWWCWSTIRRCPCPMDGQVSFV